jgi:hypoxanthine phosphoribosyltransferase
VFIGCSSESLAVADAIEKHLRPVADAVIWHEGVHHPGAVVIEKLIKRLDASDYGLFVFTADDVAKVRDGEHPIVRDNVLFEHGLFMGRLGRERSLIVMPRGAGPRLPVDLAGITYAEYEPDVENAGIAAACAQISDTIRQTELGRAMDWRTFAKAIERLYHELDANPEVGGFRPNLLVGVNEGGAVVGGLLRYRFRAARFTTVWTKPDDLPGGRPNSQVRELALLIKGTAQPLGGPCRILLVDDSFKTGAEGALARSFVSDATTKASPKFEPEVRMAVVVYRKDLHHDHDRCPPPYYYLHDSYDYFPYGRV